MAVATLRGIFGRYRVPPTPGSPVVGHESQQAREIGAFEIRATVLRPPATHDRVILKLGDLQEENSCVLRQDTIGVSLGTALVVCDSVRYFC